MNAVIVIVYMLAFCAVATYFNSREPIAFISFLVGFLFGIGAFVIAFIKDVN